MTRTLITGATGFLGGAVVARLLEQDRVDEILLLVREATTAEAISRITQRLRLYRVSEQKIALLKPGHFLLGNISHLESFKGDPRLQEVTSVINCAAVTSFGNKPKIWPINVDATMACIVERQEEFRGLFGAFHPRLLLRAIRLYGGFASLNMLFDNRRLLTEGGSTVAVFC
ncbi:MAG: SDR family oxidoreductase [Schlesneria sp.]